MSVVGCVFLGTPFRGTKSQSKASLLAEFAQTVGLGVNSGLVKLLKEGSEALSDLLDDFVTIAKEANMRLFCFFEQHESDMMNLVSRSSPIKHKVCSEDQEYCLFAASAESEARKSSLTKTQLKLLAMAKHLWHLTILN